MTAAIVEGLIKVVNSIKNKQIKRQDHVLSKHLMWVQFSSKFSILCISFLSVLVIIMFVGGYVGTVPQFKNEESG